MPESRSHLSLVPNPPELAPSEFDTPSQLQTDEQIFAPSLPLPSQVLVTAATPEQAREVLAPRPQTSDQLRGNDEAARRRAINRARAAGFYAINPKPPVTVKPQPVDVRPAKPVIPLDATSAKVRQLAQRVIDRHKK